MIAEMGVKLGVRLQREIKLHPLGKVKLAITAFEQYRSKAVVDNPGACLLTMIRDEAEPNVAQEPTTPEQNEFDCWYAEAIRVGFCLDIPKNHLGKVGNELQVKILASTEPGGYRPMPWREAKAMMEIEYSQ